MENKKYNQSNTKCPSCCESYLPPSLGVVRPHPIKNLLKYQGIDAKGFHQDVLVGFPGLPTWEDFEKMLEGLLPMPCILERHIFRKFARAKCHFWQIVGGDGSGKLEGIYTRADGTQVNISEI